MNILCLQQPALYDELYCARDPSPGFMHGRQVTLPLGHAFYLYSMILLWLYKNATYKFYLVYAIKARLEDI